MPPQIGEPYSPPNGNRLSIGDPDAVPGTEAYKGVIISEAGFPSSHVVDLPAAGTSFNVKAYFKYVQNGPNPGLAAIAPAFSVDFYVIDIEGNAATGSPYTTNVLTEPDAPAGAAAPVGFDTIIWSSVNVDIPSADLTADKVYRISVDGDDPAGYFVFHDLTIVKTK